MCIETGALNPFDPTTDTVNGTLVLPCTKLTEVGENRDVTDSEKSGGGGGGPDVLPPPQPQRTAAKRLCNANEALCLMAIDYCSRMVISGAALNDRSGIMTAFCGEII